jgi:hypothetical protein
VQVQGHHFKVGYDEGGHGGHRRPTTVDGEGGGMVGFDRSKTLQELEKCDWGEPDFDSHLVATCHRLRRIPLNQFTVEDLRIMIGQSIGLPFLLPMAVEHLERNPLSEGDFYPGDVLSAVLRIDESYWGDHPDIRERVRAVVTTAKEMLNSVDRAEAATIREVLAKAPSVLIE